MKLVIDASIGVKWFKSENEDNLEVALGLREKILDEKINGIIPDLFLYEILNTLLFDAGFTKNELNDVLNAIYLMELEVINTGRDLLERTLSIAYQCRITYYDSLYISSAQAYSAMLITEDKKILSLKNKFDFIKSLEEISFIL